MNAKTCDLFQKVPREKLEELFKNSDASAELDYDFLGFEDIYREVLGIVPKDCVVLDLGCSYTVQSWYFKDHAAYIGVDYGTSHKEKPTYKDNLAGVLQTCNSTFYFQSIQSFVRMCCPRFVWI